MSRREWDQLRAGRPEDGLWVGGTLEAWRSAEAGVPSGPRDTAFLGVSSSSIPFETNLVALTRVGAEASDRQWGVRREGVRCGC